MDGKQKTTRRKITRDNRTGKLSLKRKPAFPSQDGTNSSTGESPNLDVLKVLTGEASLDQSDDFRDVTKRLRVALKKVDHKQVKKSLASKSKSASQSKSKSSKQNEDPPTITSSSSSSKNETSKNGIGMPKLNREQTEQVPNGSANADTEDSPLPSCSVVLSMLPVTDDGESSVNHSTSKTSTVTLTSSDAKSNDPDFESRTCPVCQVQMHAGSQELQNHVNSCLKKRFSAVADTSEDELLAQQLQEREREKAVEEETTDVEFYPCQFCHKDLSRMNSTRKMQHVNRCIEVYEEERRAEEQIREKTAQSSTPDCPICGLKLNTKFQRDSHLKRCAKELNVSSAELIEIVRREEAEELASRETTQSLSEGAGPSNTSSAAKERSNLPKPRGSAAKEQSNLPKPRGRPRKNQKKPVEPSSTIDEDIQVAMAMSASIAPQNVINTAPEKQVDKNVKPKKARKKKNAKEDIPVLLVRSEGERQRMLESRLANLVAPQGAVEHLSKTPALHRSRVANKHRASETSSSQRQSRLLWELSKQVNPEFVKRTPFYVPQLGPNIVPKVVSKKPGRESRKSTPAKDDKSVSRQLNDDEPGPSQTVSSTLQALMELQEEGVPASPSSLSGVSRLNSSGFLDNLLVRSSQQHPTTTTSDHERILLGQLSGLVNSEELSDVKIKTAEGNIVHVHRLILHMRCPDLLQHLLDNCSKGVCMLDVSEQVLLSILKYVYCGSTDIDDEIAMRVLEFAQQFQMFDLAKACQPILRNRVSHRKTDDACSHSNSPSKMPASEEEYEVKDLNELLQSIWDDDEDNKSQNSNIESNKDERDECPDDEQMEEIYEYASTQQVKRDAHPRTSDRKSEVQSILETLAGKDSDDSESDDMENAMESDDDVGGGATHGETKTQIQETTHDSNGPPILQNEKEKTKCTETSSLSGSTSSNDPLDENVSHGFNTSREMIDDLINQHIDSRDASEEDSESPDVGESEDIGEDLVKGFQESDEGLAKTVTKDDSNSQSKNLKVLTTQHISSPQRPESKFLTFPPSSPVTRSLAKKVNTDDESEDIHNQTDEEEMEVSDDAKDSQDQNGSLNDSNVSWFIPDTPPATVSSSSLPRNTIMPPKTSSLQSKNSLNDRSRQSMVASTPLDDRVKRSRFTGGDYLPKMSPVKVVLEKLTLDSTIAGYVTQKSSIDTVQSETNSNKISKSNNQLNRQKGLRSSRKRRASQRDSDSPSPGRRRSRPTQDGSPSGDNASSDSPSPGRRRSRPTQDGSPRNKRRNASNNSPKADLRKSVLSPKVNRQIQDASPANHKTIAAVRKSRRKSTSESAVVISDESRSPSPTPSPTFGASSLATKSKRQNLEDLKDKEFPTKSSQEKPIQRPAKRKRKQSMPMRSPDKLLLTTCDAPVLVTPNDKQESKTQKKSKSPMTRRKTPSYFSVKKKYKSFAPVRNKTWKFKKTRSLSKATSGDNASLTNGENCEACVIQAAAKDLSQEKEQEIDLSCEKATPVEEIQMPTLQDVRVANRDVIPEDTASNGTESSDDLPSVSIGTNIHNGIRSAGIVQEDTGSKITDDLPPSGLNTDDDDIMMVSSPDDVNTPEIPRTPAVVSTPPVVVRSSPGDGPSQQGNLDDQVEEEPMFAFDVDNGPYEDNGAFESFNSPTMTNNNLDQTSRLKSQKSQVAPSPNRGTRANGRLANSQLTPVVNNSPRTRLRSPPEVRIPRPRQRGKIEGFSEVYITPSRSMTAPVITEKVATLEEFTVRQPRLVDTDYMGMQSAALVPSHRQATASPTLRDHPLSPTQMLATSPTSNSRYAADDVVYFGCASESFMMQDEEVIEIAEEVNEIAEEVNGFHDQDAERDEPPFVPPGKSKVIL